MESRMPGGHRRVSSTSAASVGVPAQVQDPSSTTSSTSIATSLPALPADGGEFAEQAGNLNPISVEDLVDLLRNDLEKAMRCAPLQKAEVASTSILSLLPDVEFSRTLDAVDRFAAVHEEDGKAHLPEVVPRIVTGSGASRTGSLGHPLEDLGSSGAGGSKDHSELADFLAREMFQLYVTFFVSLPDGSDWISDPGPSHRSSIKEEAAMEMRHACFAHFLGCLRRVSQLYTPERFAADWWGTLLRPLLQLPGLRHQEVLAAARDLVLSALVAWPEEPRSNIGTNTQRHVPTPSSDFRRDVVEMYLAYAKVDTDVRNMLAGENTSDKRGTCAQLERILIEFGVAKPKVFFTLLDGYFRRAPFRHEVLHLLTTFARNQEMYLYHVPSTPLLNSILDRLTHDTNVSVVAPGVNFIVMMMPSICTSIPPLLPRLFAILSRLLCWNYKIFSSDNSNKHSEDEPSLHCGKVGSASTDFAGGSLAPQLQWETQYGTGRILSPMKPSCLALFTFLYGMYPCNLLQFFKSPSAYFKERPLPAEQVCSTSWMEDIDEMLRAKCKSYIGRFAVHPDLLSCGDWRKELEDNSRWMKVEPADIAAFCVSLRTSSWVGGEGRARPAVGSGDEFNDFGRLWETDREWKVLVEEQDDGKTGILNVEDDKWDQIQQSVLIPPPISTEPLPVSKLSYIDTGTEGLSEDHSPNAGQQCETGDSTEELRKADIDSILRLHLVLESGDPVHLGIDSCCEPQYESFSGCPYGDLVDAPDTNRSTGPETIDGSATGRNHCCDLGALVVELHRYALLLHNELNYELFLKRQCMRHIGRLQKEHVIESALEAERQSMYATQRTLRAEVKILRDALEQSRNEASATKNKHKRWEGDINTKLRTVREERKALEEEIARMREELSAAEAANRQVASANERIFMLENEIKTLEPQANKASELEHRVKQLAEQLVMWQGDTARISELERQVEALLAHINAQKLELEAEKAAAKSNEHNSRKAVEDLGVAGTRIEELESRLTGREQRQRAELDIRNAEIRRYQRQVQDAEKRLADAVAENTNLQLDLLNRPIS